MGAAEVFGGFRQNVLGDTLRVCQRIRVPESDDPPTLALRIGHAPLIVRRLIDMLASVELDPERGLTRDRC